MTDLPSELRTEALFDVRIDLAPAETMGATPLGQRSVQIVTGGTFEGPRLRGTVRPGGGRLAAGAAERRGRVGRAPLAAD